MSRAEASVILAHLQHSQTSWWSLRVAHELPFLEPRHVSSLCYILCLQNGQMIGIFMTHGGKALKSPVYGWWEWRARKVFKQLAQGTELVATNPVLPDSKALIFNTLPHKCTANSEVGKSHLYYFQLFSPPLTTIHHFVLVFPVEF